TTISADTDGSYTITLTATDSLSRTDSASFTLLWDTTAPVITIATPNLGSISSPQSAGVTVSDSGSGVDTIVWTKVSGPGSVNMAPDEFTDNPAFSATLSGTYVMRVDALDAVGNASYDTLTFIWDGDPATPYITNPVGGYVAGNAVTNVTWVSSGEANLDHFSLWYSDDSGSTWLLLDDAIASSSSSYPWLAPGVDTDGNLFKLAVFNVATNSTTTVSLPFSIDSTLPSSLAVTSPDAFTLPHKGGSSLDIAWTGGDDEHLGATPILIEYSESGNFDDTVSLGQVANSGTYTWTVPAVDTATNTKIRVTSSDLAGNQRVGTSSAFVIDSLAPDITLTSDFGNVDAAFNPNPLVADNVDLDSDLNYYWSLVSAPSGGHLNFSVPFVANPSISGDEAGIYSARLTVTDRAGNQSSAVLSFNWLGGSGYPDVIYPSTGDYIPAGNTTILWTTPNIANLSSYQVEYSDDSGVTWTTLATGLAASATSTVWNIAAGVNSVENMIRVTAYDNLDIPFAANSGLFTIDSSAPVIDLIASLGTINSATAVTASTTDNFDDASQLSYSWSVLSAPSGGNLFISSSTILTPSLSANVNGGYSALLAVTDRAGNMATSSTAFTWYIPSGGGGGGGGGGSAVTYCSQVYYGPWGTCVNGSQTRSIVSRTPLNCSLSTEQQL
ncbi:MAG: hypothetical protein PHG95_04015, partial [Patescibacteria group bacterium]|nr:hypothetical protein [Patescibacteria group bacterium]